MPPSNATARRALILGAAAGLVRQIAAQPPLPAIHLILGDLPPSGLAPQAMNFTQAYAACPGEGSVPRGILTGRFPHSDAPVPQLALSESSPIVVFTSTRPGRIPLLLRHPSLKPDQADFLVSHVDLLPTILALEGLEIPPGVHGRDVLHGDRPESIYGEGDLAKPTEWRMLIRGLDKIVFDRGLQPIQLFNLADDPSETENLVRDPAQQLKIAGLRALLKLWIRRTEDRMDASGLKRR